MGFLSAIGGIIGSVIPGVGTAIGAGLGGLGDSLIAGSAAKSAAKTQAAGADAATKLQADIYNQNRADQLPWINQGTSAVNQLGWLLGLNSASGGANQPANGAGTASSPASPAPISNAPFLREGAIRNQNGTYQYQGRTLYADGLNLYDESGSRVGTIPELSGTGNLAGTGILTGGGTSAPAGSTTGATADPYATTNKATGGFGSLAKPFGASDFQADPGYDFRISEGMKALQRSAASKGGLLSGATLKAITRFGQDTASGEYQNAYNRYNTNQTNLYNRLAGVAGTGQTAVNNIGAQGQEYASNAGALTNASAYYNAKGNAANANAWSTGLGNIGGIFSGAGGGGGLPWQQSGNVNPAGGYY